RTTSWSDSTSTTGARGRSAVSCGSWHARCPSSSAAAVRHDSLATEGNRWMKLALVGLGYWGSKLLRNMVTLVGPQNVVAVDASSALVDSAAASYPGLTCRATLEDALDD